MNRQRCASDIHGPYDDECLGSRCLVGLPARPSRPSICSRHGGPLDYNAGMRHPCWECAMEMDEADRDRAER